MCGAVWLKRSITVFDTDEKELAEISIHPRKHRGFKIRYNSMVKMFNSQTLISKLGQTISKRLASV